jgi:hypothetical protein
MSRTTVVRIGTTPSRGSVPKSKTRVSDSAARSSLPLRGGAIALTIVTLSVVVAVMVSSGGGDDSRTAQGDPYRATGEAGVTTVGEAPIVVLPGSQLFSAEPGAVEFFGSEARTGGAGRSAGGTFEPSTGKWTQWPDAPFSAPLIEQDAVWTGDELVVVGILCNNTAGPDDEAPVCDPGTLAAAAFNPDKQAWRDVPSPEVTGDVAVDGWGYAIGWSGSEAVFSTGAALQAFNPQTSIWASLPGLDHASYCANDHGLYGVKVARGEEDIGLRQHVVAALELNRIDVAQRTWTTVATAALAATDQPNSPDVVCGDDSILIYDAVDFSQVFLADLGKGTIAEVAAPSADLVRTHFPEVAGKSLPVSIAAFDEDHRAWTGNRFVFWSPATTIGGVGPENDQTAQLGATTAVFDPATGTWTQGADGPTLSSSQPHQVAWARGVGYLAEHDKQSDHPKVLAYEPVKG